MPGRHTATFVIAASLAAATASAAPAHRPGNINARQRHQAERIENGKADGQLTRGELDRLRGDEAAIRAEEHVYRRSGQGLNPAERKDLERDLNRTSREIYRARHNQRQPG
jgi:hypothetical protein